VSQDNTGQAHVARISTRETGEYDPEDKIRIVLEGFRREVTVGDFCRREGVKPSVFYAWTKEIVKAGKERLTRGTVRDAIRQEIDTSSGRTTI
jgi:transposase